MLGLALEGGGAKGAYHIGAYRALTEEGLVFDGVTGTSIGALNGAMIAQGDFERLEDWWKSADSSALFDVDQMKINRILNNHIDRETLHYLLKRTRTIINNRGMDTKRIRETLKQFIDEEKLRVSPIDFGLVTVAISLSKLKPLEIFKEDIPNGQIIDYLMASANLPVFKIEPVDGKYFIDGGFYDNCPINLLIQKGYKEIFAIRTLGPGISRPMTDPSVKVTKIVPSENIGNVLNFDPETINKNIRMGYCDAKRALLPLAGTRYYIQNAPVPRDFFKAFSQVNKSAVEAIANRLWLPRMDENRMIFEQIVPEAVSFLSLGETASYRDVGIGVLESLAESCGIDRLSIISMDAFIAALKSAERPKPDAYKSDKAFVLGTLGEALLERL